MNLIGAGVSSLRLSISIVAFVENVTRERSPDFVSPGERIAAGSEAKKKNLMLIAWKDDVPRKPSKGPVPGGEDCYSCSNCAALASERKNQLI
jgi:hypothetical protein